ncbi:phosphoglycerate kinase [Iodidimonas nitroreducens]|uniref:Phosphoglycerate kinase n=1 Tax=Iodidimonas nitroreducens TaxID=1236968 RepID=A0A5A7NBS8_9PROT|nr:phosphoglycerate kinase [Iodidimonas nitroreducens]GAK33479.1 phosphoglycerate kinase [alpha proteobacterium Q-1]GER04416.1 phosphoglycerate kinase [Iodidimonas nitroreducens]
MTAYKRIADLGDLSGKTALVRADLNVPIQDGRVADDTRIKAAVATVKALRQKGAQVALLSHFGRPKGAVVPDMSLEPLVPALEAAFGEPVGFAADCIGPVAAAALKGDAGIVLLQNLRFHEGEEANDPAFAGALAALGDLYVNDAFSAAHRAHASTVGLAHLLPHYAGETMAMELDALEKALGNPTRPVAAIVGGAKVSSKLDVLTHLVEKVDHLIIGGGMANSFLFAQGHAIGTSLAERDLADTARAILERAKAAGCTIHLPIDAMAAKAFAENAPHRIAAITDIADDEMILDAGPATVEALKQVLQQAKTLVWNGPMGAFELKPFDQATMALAHEAGRLTKASHLLSVAGGGDTVSAINLAGVGDQLTHISTAGGAFLEWMEGKTLPGVAALEG